MADARAAGRTALSIRMTGLRRFALMSPSFVGDRAGRWRSLESSTIGAPLNRRVAAEALGPNRRSPRPFARCSRQTNSR